MVELNTSAYVEPILDDIVVPIELDTASPISAKLMEHDCSDLRVWDDDYVTPLSFWLEPDTCNSSATKLWVYFAALNTTADAATIFLSYGLQTEAPSMNGEAVFRFMDGKGRRWGTDSVQTSGAWSYVEFGTDTSASEFGVYDGYFNFRGEHKYTSMPRTLRPVASNESVTVRARYTIPSSYDAGEATAQSRSSATYVMYISKVSNLGKVQWGKLSTKVNHCRPLSITLELGVS